MVDGNSTVVIHVFHRKYPFMEMILNLIYCLLMLLLRQHTQTALKFNTLFFLLLYSSPLKSGMQIPKVGVYILSNDTIYRFSIFLSFGIGVFPISIRLLAEEKGKFNGVQYVCA